MIFAVTLIRTWLLQLPQSFGYLSHSCKVTENPSRMYNAQLVKRSLIKRYFYEKVKVNFMLHTIFCNFF